MKKGINRKIIGLILAVSFCICMLPAGSAAAEEIAVDGSAFTISGEGLADGTDYKFENNVLTILSGKAITIKNTGSGSASNRIEVAGGVSANITLAGVNISASSGAAFMIADNSTGNVTITLADGTTNILTSGESCAGLQKNGAYSEALGTLTIEGNTGKLTANGGAGGAGIGGGNVGGGQDGSKIVINGGIVNANGGNTSAGIGGGGGRWQGSRGGSGNHITINGGTVTALGEGRDYGSGAGIGGAQYGSGHDILITGGNVTAKCVAYYAAGIGGGSDADGYNITITGGTVTAQGGGGGNYGGGAGIGGGRSSAGDNIEITGGNVTATGGRYSAGIGGGRYGSGGNITITGGTVTATGDGGGDDIGGGNGGSEGNISISGGTVNGNKYYSVIVVDSIGGTVTPDKPGSAPGETITLTAAPDTGYEFEKMTVTSGNGDVALTDNSFIMPSSDVTVTSEWIKLSYTITVGDKIENGMVEAPQTAGYNDTVTLKITPDAGYELDKITVVPENGEPFEESSGTFTMPADNVMVTAEFKEMTEAVPGDEIVEIPEGGTVRVGDDIEIELPRGGTMSPDGTITADEIVIGDMIVKGEDMTIDPDGNITLPEGGDIVTGDMTVTVLPGGTAESNGDGTFTVPAGSVVTKDGESVTVPEGGMVITPGAAEAKPAPEETEPPAAGPAPEETTSAGSGAYRPGPPSSGAASGGTAPAGAAVPTSSEKLLAAVMNANDGDTLSIDLKGDTSVEKYVFDEIAGRDITVIWVLNGSSYWKINGTDIEKARKVDLGVSLNSKAAAADEIKELAGDKKTIKFTLRHRGEFGFTGYLSIPVSGKYNGQYANLYYYNKSGEFEFVGSSEISGGYAEFAFSHASDYVVVIDKEAYGDDVSSAAGIYAVSGIVENTVPIVGPMILIAVSMTLLLKKRSAK